MPMLPYWLLRLVRSPRPSGCALRKFWLAAELVLGVIVSSAGAFVACQSDPRSRQKWADNGVLSGHSGRRRTRLGPPGRIFPEVWTIKLQTSGTALNKQYGKPLINGLNPEWRERGRKAVGRLSALRHSCHRFTTACIRTR